VSQQLVSLLERGGLERLTVSSARAMARAIGVTLPVDPRWTGGNVAAVLDEEHSRIVEAIARRLRDGGWEVLVEHTFNHFGERGSIDLVGWRPASSALLVVEAKSRIVDVQDLLSTLDRKARLAPRLLAAERNWHPLHRGRVLVAPGTTAVRTAIERHTATFRATLPAGTLEVRRWLAEPTGDLRGVWLLAPTNTVRAKRPDGGSRRIRAPARAPARGAGRVVPSVDDDA
jgi:hypothetical protein